MKYFSKIGNIKSRAVTVEADLTRGLCTPRYREKNSATGLLNFSSAVYPWLKNRERFRYLNYALDFSHGVGIHNDTFFYAVGNKFYYGADEKFEVSEGKKQFCVFNGRILIFPDMLYFNPETDEHGRFGFTTGEITYTIAHRTTAGVDCGLSGINSADIDLTQYFKVGDGIKITDEQGLGISGFHTIIGIVRQLKGLVFEKFEFGDGESYTLTGKLSHGSPETCDAACISGGRVWVAGDNKIYASTLGDECNWAVAGDDEKSSFVCNLGGGEKINACIDLEGNPVFFSENKIYKIYGDRASNFYLKCCANWGGVSRSMRDTVAVVRDKIFYVSPHGLTCFDGSTPRVLERTPFEATDVVTAASDGKRYYAVVAEAAGNRLYVYDETYAQWHDYGKYDFQSFFTYEGALCAATASGVTVLSGSFPLMDTQAYLTENILELSASFELDTDGASPVELSVDAESIGSSGHDIYVSWDGGARKFLGRISGTFSGVKVIPLIPRACQGFEVFIEGRGTLTLRKISVKCVG